ncbi:MAG: phosphatidate cytidylyltransferase [Verrucomicrobiae bacterium]|nr:phosphatidate cytidylyltransferase [Verrucomicrobiae bacterium]
MARSNFLRRAFSTLLLWGLILGVIIFDWDWGFGLLIPAIGTIALGEFFYALRNKGIRSFRKTGIVSGLFFLIGSWLILSGRVTFLSQALFELICLLIFLLGILSRQVFDRSQTTPVLTVAVTFFGIFYVIWLFNFVTRLVYFPATGREPFLLLYLLLVTKMTDIGAYIGGSLFGRHKLLPEVSPKKTWEGFIVGVLCSVGVSYGLIAGFPERLTLIPKEWAIGLGLIISLVSVVGDLAESVMKRDTQVKDSGGFIPGIGGALDLIDSVLFTAPVLYLFLQLRATL